MKNKKLYATIFMVALALFACNNSDKSSDNGNDDGDNSTPASIAGATFVSETSIGSTIYTNRLIFSDDGETVTYRHTASSTSAVTERSGSYTIENNQITVERGVIDALLANPDPVRLRISTDGNRLTRLNFFGNATETVFIRQ
ncbi:MAG: hypothetical protein FWE37_08375 [Spirochaetaceae bacterium]|nr:hypothetical protein [Spirochaetaceae bacterium]